MSRSLGLDSRVEPCSGWGLGSGLKMLLDAHATETILGLLGSIHRRLEKL